jgi:expansin (peptidoglycan-binding protein)
VRGPIALTTLALSAVALLGPACASSDGATGGAGSSGAPASGGPSGSYATGLKQGVATYYDATGDGSCGFGPSSNLDVSAFDLANFAGSASCGSCVSVSGPKGAITVRVVDSCPDCTSNHMDLSQEAFAKIADVSAGRVPITFQVVACDVTGNLSYRFKEGSSRWWTALQIRNHRVPIAKVEYRRAGLYTDMPRTDYNYFVDTGGVGDQPSGIALRVTAADGQVLEDTVPSVQPGVVLPGSVQFK